MIIINKAWFDQTVGITDNIIKIYNFIKFDLMQIIRKNHNIEQITFRCNVRS